MAKVRGKVGAADAADLVNVGIDYPDREGVYHRAEVGALVRNIPEEYRGDLLAAGVISAGLVVDGVFAPASAPAADEETQG